MKINSNHLTQQTTQQTTQQIASQQVKRITPQGGTPTALEVPRDDQVFFTQRVKDAFGIYEIQACESLQQAIYVRSHECMPAMTMREMDITLRGKMDVTNQFFWAAMFQFEGFLSEGYVGYSDSPYELRVQYNNGRRFLRDEYAAASDDIKQRADNRMKVILYGLSALKISPWPEEEEAGCIHTQLTKPEFMTFEQYAKMHANFAVNKNAVNAEEEARAFMGVVMEKDKKQKAASERVV